MANEASIETLIKEQISLSQSAFAQRSVTEDNIALWVQLKWDHETALSAFGRLNDTSPCFFFESVEGGEKWARYSFIGLGARRQFKVSDENIIVTDGLGRDKITPIKHGEDPLPQLRNHLSDLELTGLPADIPRIAAGAVGFVSYDWIRRVEDIGHVGQDGAKSRNKDVIGLPEIHFIFPETVLIHDRLRQSLTVIVTPSFAINDGDVSPEARYGQAVKRLTQLATQLIAPQSTDLRPATTCTSTPNSDTPTSADLEQASNFTRSDFEATVTRCKDLITAGDIFQVVPSQRFSFPLRCNSDDIYRELRAINPSPYLFHLKYDNYEVIGSSPEILVRLEDDIVTVRPVAGTRPRGSTQEADAAHEADLLADDKEIAEHVMLVDLGRNDVGRIAQIGTVDVKQYQVVEKYSHVMHIVSTVCGRLKPDLDGIDVLRATFPAGTLSGAPKVRAMQIIETCEPSARGIYGGAVGYIEPQGNMDMCIAIRSLVVKDNMVHIQAGAGIVSDSVPATEYEETLHKAGALFKAVRAAEHGGQSHPGQSDE